MLTAVTWLHAQRLLLTDQLFGALHVNLVFQLDDSMDSVVLRWQAIQDGQELVGWAYNHATLLQLCLGSLNVCKEDLDLLIWLAANADKVAEEIHVTDLGSQLFVMVSHDGPGVVSQPQLEQHSPPQLGPYLVV